MQSQTARSCRTPQTPHPSPRFVVADSADLLIPPPESTHGHPTQQTLGPQEERLPYASPPHAAMYPYLQALLALMAVAHALNLFQLIQMQKPVILNLVKLILILSLIQW